MLAPGTEPPTEYNRRIADVWMPVGNIHPAREWTNRDRHNWMVIARLKPEVTVSQANAEMQSIGAALSREFPGTNREVGAFVSPLREHFVSSTRRVLLILLGTVGMVLLIACSNLANLLLSPRRESHQGDCRTGRAGGLQLADCPAVCL